MKIPMAVFLLALPVAARAAAHAPSPTLDQLQECAAGHCWDTKGVQVTAPPPGSILMKEPVRVRSAWDKKPKEPPRYTVISKDEVHDMRQRQAYAGTAVGAACGAMLGFLLGGIPGAVVGGLLAGAAAYFFLRPKA